MNGPSISMPVAPARVLISADSLCEATITRFPGPRPGGATVPVIGYSHTSLIPGVLGASLQALRDIKVKISPCMANRLLTDRDLTSDRRLLGGKVDPEAQFVYYRPLMKAESDIWRATLMDGHQQPDPAAGGLSRRSGVK